MCVSVCAFYLQFRGDGGVPRHRLGRQIVVAVRAVEEGLSPLVVTGEVGVEDQARAGGGLRVQGAAAGRRAILHVKTEGKRQRRIDSLLILSGKFKSPSQNIEYSQFYRKRSLLLRVLL